MKANIKTILGQNMFDRVSYIVPPPPKVVLLDILKYLVDILVSLHHNYFRVILGLVSLNYPQWRLFDRNLVKKKQLYPSNGPTAGNSGLCYVLGGETQYI